MLKKLCTLLGVLGISSCSNTKLIEYHNELPKLDVQAFINGKIKGYGIVENRQGIVTRRFEFNGNGYWKDNVGYFDETISYINGNTESRTWEIHKIYNNYYEATTADVIDKAKIYIDGNSMNWQYVMKIKVDNKIYNINFDDWMYLIDEHKIINRNYFTKFGFNVGQLTLFMEKVK
jgi:hypothetical protein